jgi:hypothetical protein
MPHQVTVTGKTGPDRTLTAAPIANVTQVDFQLNDKRLFIHTEQGAGDNVKEIDLSTVTGVVVAISGGNFTFTVT